MSPLAWLSCHTSAAAAVLTQKSAKESSLRQVRWPSISVACKPPQQLLVAYKAWELAREWLVLVTATGGVFCLLSSSESMVLWVRHTKQDVFRFCHLLLHKVFQSTADDDKLRKSLFVQLTVASETGSSSEKMAVKTSRSKDASVAEPLSLRMFRLQASLRQAYSCCLAGSDSGTHRQLLLDRLLSHVNSVHERAGSLASRSHGMISCISAQEACIAVPTKHSRTVKSRTNPV